ncbi:zinc finger and SCAN domain-containing protein 10 [Betta splendens]|uniref:Zinc finger and SCAN domain-containing protein 10 n=1 Tax=Betta splendens TaxID=158456 RepID=A0A6P7N372_BETSP|nr:zinc finger and SCAN domain-containing protein 10 [Betta splendens]
MDGVSWSTTASPESFSRSKTPSETLSRLASLIARAETKHHTRTQRQEPSHLSTCVCQECGEGFPYTTDLLHHQDLKHALPKPHRCPLCGQEFSLRSSLQLHKCDQESSSCELCDGESQLSSPCPACMTLPSDPNRQEKSFHRQPHLLDSSPYACAPCGRGFSQKQALLQHQQAGCTEPPSSSDVVKASSLPDDSPPVSEGDSPRSDTSDTPGPSSRGANMCQCCLRTFRTQAALQQHKHTNHTEKMSTAPRGKRAKGESTGEEVRRRGNIKVNGAAKRRLNTKQKLLSCRSCDMVFRNTSKLYMHRKENHTRDKIIQSEPRPVITKRRRTGTYPCQICGKVFMHHLSLRAHYRQHHASFFTSIRSKSHTVECVPTKDSSLSEHNPNQVKSSPADSKTVRAGPGRPKRVARLGAKDQHQGLCREGQELKQTGGQEEDEEEEKEFPCPSCVEVFPLQSQLREHMELHQSSVKRRQCCVCTNEMDTCKWPSSKRQRLYHCVPCQQGFTALDPFLEHCQEHLRVRVEEDRIAEASKA